MNAGFPAFSHCARRVGLTLLLGTMISGALTACEPLGQQQRIAELEKSLEGERAKTKQLRLELAAEKAEIAAMEQVYTSRPRPAAAPPAVEPTPTVSKPAVEMCFKDYCPCDPPQGGPDTVICDQLEQGIPVDIQLMIGGRGMREARRQMAEGDY